MEQKDWGNSISSTKNDVVLDDGKCRHLVYLTIHTTVFWLYFYHAI